jgi:organic hydroperoxide reductase OsmC/OhrA
MNNSHHYTVNLNWTGNTGSGTSSYTSYQRSHTISINNKSEILGSSDPSFRGDPGKHNPEELFIASISSCHMLWYLHLCAEAGILVTNYVDNTTGLMIETSDGGGRFKEVILNPVVTISEGSDIQIAYDLHKRANEHCFIANSLNFPVSHNAVIRN